MQPRRFVVVDAGSAASQRQHQHRQRVTSQTGCCCAAPQITSIRERRRNARRDRSERRFGGDRSVCRVQQPPTQSPTTSSEPAFSVAGEIIASSLIFCSSSSSSGQPTVSSGHIPIRRTAKTFVDVVYTRRLSSPQCRLVLSHGRTAAMIDYDGRRLQSRVRCQQPAKTFGPIARDQNDTRSGRNVDRLFGAR